MCWFNLCLNIRKYQFNIFITPKSKMIVVPFEQFEQVFEPLLQNQTKALFLVTSQKGQDGSYWCPDCQAIVPLYSKFEEEAKKAGLPFYVFIAGDKPTWKDPENKFRKHKLLTIKSVPTMGLFDGKKLVNKLQEAQIEDNEQRSLLFE